MVWKKPVGDVFAVHVCLHVLSRVSWVLHFTLIQRIWGKGMDNINNPIFLLFPCVVWCSGHHFWTSGNSQEIRQWSILGPRLKIPHKLKMPFSSTLLLNLKTIDDLRGMNIWNIDRNLRNLSFHWCIIHGIFGFFKLITMEKCIYFFIFYPSFLSIANVAKKANCVFLENNKPHEKKNGISSSRANPTSEIHMIGLYYH